MNGPTYELREENGVGRSYAHLSSPLGRKFAKGEKCPPKPSDISITAAGGYPVYGAGEKMNTTVRSPYANEQQARRGKVGMRRAQSASVLPMSPIDGGSFYSQFAGGSTGSEPYVPPDPVRPPSVTGRREGPRVSATPEKGSRVRPSSVDCREKVPDLNAGGTKLSSNKQATSFKNGQTPSVQRYKETEYGFHHPKKEYSADSNLHGMYKDPYGSQTSYVGVKQTYWKAMPRQAPPLQERIDQFKPFHGHHWDKNTLLQGELYQKTEHKNRMRRAYSAAEGYLIPAPDVDREGRVKSMKGREMKKPGGGGTLNTGYTAHGGTMWIDPMNGQKSREQANIGAVMMANDRAAAAASAAKGLVQ